MTIYCDKDGSIYSLREDYSMKNLQEPGDLSEFLAEYYGPNFERMTQEERLILITIVADRMVDGGRICDRVLQWQLAREGLDLDILGTELDAKKGAVLLKRLTAGLDENHLL